MPRRGDRLLALPEEGKRPVPIGPERGRNDSCRNERPHEDLRGHDPSQLDRPVDGELAQSPRRAERHPAPARSRRNRRHLDHVARPPWRDRRGRRTGSAPCVRRGCRGRREERRMQRPQCARASSLREETRPARSCQAPACPLRCPHVHRVCQNSRPHARHGEMLI